MKIEVWMIEGTMLFRAVGVSGPMNMPIGMPGSGRSVAEAIGNYYLRNRDRLQVFAYWQDTGALLEPFRELFEREDGTPTTCGDDAMPLPANDEMDRVQAQRRILDQSTVELAKRLMSECDVCGKPLSGKACTNPECVYAPPVEDQK